MINTLIKIGEWQSHGKSEWDRFLEIPKVDTEDQRGNSIKNYTLPIIFDLDEQEVIIDVDNLEEFDEGKLLETIPLKTKGGNNKATYSSVPAKKLIQIYKTFFGKENEETKHGELIEAIEKLDPRLLTDNFNSLLDQIFSLKEKFLEKTQITMQNGEKSVDIKAINDVFNLNKSEKIVFLITKVKAAEFGYNYPILFSQVSEYKGFLEALYFPSQKQTEGREKLCYANGKNLLDVKVLSIDNRESLNKMFVTTTQNYAQEWEEDNFFKNYQVSLKNQEYLDLGSNYLLHNGYVVRIANANHVIIPEFPFNREIDLDFMESIRRKTDLLFKRGLEKLDLFAKSIQDELEDNEVFWINFLAFDKGGKKYFKTTGCIKDVSSFHFQRMLSTFFEIDNQFEKDDFVDWNSVMTNYNFDRKEMRKSWLNFSSFYTIIPIKEKSGTSFILRNKALDLFKTILENRKISADILYDYFTELILYHFYDRYKEYTNVKNYSQKGKKKRQDYFKWAVRDSVFKYLAFFQFLKKLNLIDMEETTTTAVKTGNEYDQKEQDFIGKMNFSQEQKAMFYLGRILSKVESIQNKDKKKKTVIEKVNFNGLEIGNIQRLRNDLNEKAKQYRLKYPKETKSVIFIDNRFANYFDYNQWVVKPLNPQEALFFLLTGYSFGAKSSNSKGDEDKNNDNENESNQ